jgi:hypothetical protein
MPGGSTMTATAATPRVASTPRTTPRWISAGNSPRNVARNKAMAAIHDRYSTCM